jgi:adhesin/invasin
MATTITSNTVTVDVTAPLTINLTASPLSVNGSGTVTFTATLSGGTASTSGVTVTFIRNGTSEGTGITGSNGVATFAYTYSNVSTGVDDWAAQAEGVSSNIVNITLGVTWTIVLEVNGATGTVDVTEGAAATATVTLTNNGSVSTSSIPVTLTDATTSTSQQSNTSSNGVATFSITFSSTGTYNLYATASVP